MAALAFVDPSGAPIANGKMIVGLNTDGKSATGQVHSQLVSISLDSSGTPVISGVHLLSGLTNNYDSNNAPSYMVTVYNALGERVWGPAPLDIDGVIISPVSTSVGQNSTKQFTAAVTSLNTFAVVWSIVELATGATINQSGLFSSHSSFGTFHVRVTMVSDPTIFDTATIVVS